MKGDLFLDNGPAVALPGQCIGLMARERLRELAEVRAELGQVRDEIEARKAELNPPPEDEAYLQRLRERRVELRTTGAESFLPNLVPLVIAEALDPSPTDETVYGYKN